MSEIPHGSGSHELASAEQSRLADDNGSASCARCGTHIMPGEARYESDQFSDDVCSSCDSALNNFEFNEDDPQFDRIAADAGIEGSAE